ncbi:MULTISPECIES: hypothetical protein [Moorena]|nr:MULTISPECIES: hypothetical protein [Moorena]NEP36428.1 hypothetical protein [Moorena sp. SIO3B2]NEP70130.1 hypothetical protein [Moorena sp. SIO3A5]NER92106.1 hypothetical protein [Moorena sp. SIO3A2]NET63820.1 hypothetical protein [Moorena sp. SIO1G6]
MRYAHATRTAVSGQPSAFSLQPSAVSRQPSAFGCSLRVRVAHKHLK